MAGKRTASGSLRKTSFLSGLWHCPHRTMTCRPVPPSRIGDRQVGESERDRLQVVSPWSMTAFAANPPIGRLGACLLTSGTRDRGVAIETGVEIVIGQHLAQEIFAGREISTRGPASRPRPIHRHNRKTGARVPGPLHLDPPASSRDRPIQMRNRPRRGRLCRRHGSQIGPGRRIDRSCGSLPPAPARGSDDREE